MVNLMERAEKIFPSLTPEDLMDTQPIMKPIAVDENLLFPYANKSQHTE
jgi:hypothetical protein